MSKRFNNRENRDARYKERQRAALENRPVPRWAALRVAPRATGDGAPTGTPQETRPATLEETPGVARPATRTVARGVAGDVAPPVAPFVAQEETADVAEHVAPPVAVHDVVQAGPGAMAINAWAITAAGVGVSMANYYLLDSMLEKMMDAAPAQAIALGVVLSEAVAGHSLIERMRERRFDVVALVALLTMAFLATGEWGAADVREVVMHQQAALRAHQQTKPQQSQVTSTEVKARQHDPYPDWCVTDAQHRKWDREQERQDKLFNATQLAAIKSTLDTAATQQTKQREAEETALTGILSEHSEWEKPMLRLFALGMSLALGLAAGQWAVAVPATFAIFRREPKPVKQDPRPKEPRRPEAPRGRRARWRWPSLLGPGIAAGDEPLPAMARQVADE
jgi:hypothetical protein